MKSIKSSQLQGYGTDLTLPGHFTGNSEHALPAARIFE